MFWRLIDPHHPEYDAALAAQYGSALPEFYQQIDQVLGEVMQRMDDHTTLLVLSDHGFAPYNRSFNLNTWLLNNGYITLKSEPNPDQNQAFANVDWSHTRAYGLGLNGLYLNLKGREREGIVEPGAAADALLKEIKEKLLAVRDPAEQSGGDYAGGPGQRGLSGPVRAAGARSAGRLQPRLSRRMADHSGQLSCGRVREQHESLERRPLHGLHAGAGRAAEQSAD